MSQEPTMHRITVLTLNQRKPTVDRYINPTIIKHDLNLKKFNVACSTNQNDAASRGIPDKVTLTLSQFSESSQERNQSKMRASKKMEAPNDRIDHTVSEVLAGTVCKSQQKMSDPGHVVVKKIGGKDDIKDGVCNESSSDYKTLHITGGRKVVIKTFIRNSKSGGKNSVEGLRTNKNECDDSHELPKVLKWKVVRKDNISSLTSIKHSPVKVGDIIHEQNSQKGTPTNTKSLLLQKQEQGSLKGAHTKTMLLRKHEQGSLKGAHTKTMLLKNHEQGSLKGAHTKTMLLQKHEQDSLKGIPTNSMLLQKHKQNSQKGIPTNSMILQEHEQNCQKGTPTNSMLLQKQPVVILKKLKMDCVFSKSDATDDSVDCDTAVKDCDTAVIDCDTAVKEENQESFVETSEEGMFLRDMAMPHSAETSCPTNVKNEATEKEKCDCNLSTISKELEEEIQSAVQSNIEEMMISSQINNGEGFSYTFPYACGQCSYTAKLQHHLKNHMKIHSSDRPFVCDICGKGFKHAHHLAGHKRTHSGERPYSCDECGRDFTQISNLLRHQKTHQGLTDPVHHKCYKCNRSFSTAYSLKRHSDVHENLKERVKTIKRYKGKGKRKRCHYNPTVDDKRRQFECAICGRKFLRKEHVTRHMLTHTGESVYSCDVCGKGYSGKQALNKHITIHTGDHLEIDSEQSSSDEESGSEEDMEYV
ncbi:zinc finger protein 37 homolog [Ostrea edulis]|uniref:zinc finger protein 37 homolog n=1 Tax=Ostrea edulis TaxID=37623 RepID=UPI0024AED442|nr:zinc finger protein 37 homolog [Ostrea edulis]